MHSIKAARDRLRHLATTSKGRECGLELIQDAQAALFSDGPAPPGDATSTPQMQRTEVRIDHMNDRAAYAKLLKAWAAPDLGAKLSYRAAPKPNRPRRVEDAMLTLDGPQDAISSFLRRLRTELVDVDSKGKKCKEKCSTVLSQRFLADEKGLVGWSETLTTHAAPSEALPAWVTAAADGCLVDVHVHTGKQETAIARCGDALEVDVSAPPRDGAANDAVCAFFAKLLGVSKSAVTLRQGAKSRSKTLHCRGVTPAQAQRSVSGNAPDTRR
ncbi:hypothetical protein M885DRAFT_253132 [Pelagophyceae sp. CCMP2097]|nr:hypothetical protein M885DRAFT_253132 [Pelagophyceae sp. CCMP2097]